MYQMVPSSSQQSHLKHLKRRVNNSSSYNDGESVGERRAAVDFVENKGYTSAKDEVCGVVVFNRPS